MKTLDIHSRYTHNLRNLLHSYTSTLYIYSKLEEVKVIARPLSNEGNKNIERTSYKCMHIARTYFYVRKSGIHNNFISRHTHWFMKDKTASPIPRIHVSGTNSDKTRIL